MSGLAQLKNACSKIGLTHHFMSDIERPGENGIFIAARAPFDAGEFMANRTGKCHIIEAEIAGLTILPVHFPQKAAQVPLFQAVLEDSKSLLGLDSLIIGDLHCGIPFEDSTHRTFVNAKHFQSLKEKGWIDLYRERHGPDARDYSWISPRTGNGFRYDHVLASRSVADCLVSFDYVHGPREDKLSDHSAMLLTLSFEPKQ